MIHGALSGERDVDEVMKRRARASGEGLKEGLSPRHVWVDEPGVGTVSLESLRGTLKGRRPSLLAKARFAPEVLVARGCH